MKIDLKIKQFREFKNFSQQYIADQLGISQAYYNKLENQQVKMDFIRLSCIAQILEVSPISLITVEDNQQVKSDNREYLLPTPVSENERKLYSDQIKRLESEVNFLRKILDKKI